MTRAHGGRESEVHIDDSGATLQDISPYVTNVDAPTNIDQAEVTGFGQARKSYLPGQIDTPIGISGNFDDAAAPGAHAVLAGLVGGTVARTFQYYPKGSASGSPQLKGEVFLSAYQVTSPLSGQVTFSASLVPADSTGLVWSTV